ncbi:SA1320 family protein [Sporosarcina sp. NPDC096371]|uniref:SA1320 family protein n=1 Tax=Sporosarcina sp. NPDC096371 TaxID=3364530 RepID=UPI0037F13960
MKTVKKDFLESQYVNDVDLIELAGFHAYRPVIKFGIITVNGKKFEVTDLITSSESGLDAFTVQNTITKDYTIVYVGTDPSSIPDIITDAKLLRSSPPTQLEEGLQYFDDMEKKYGQISSVTGNSLGGGATNYVAVNRPEVKAVTLNPALLPSGSVDPNASYDNITNYMSQYDVLTGGVKALGYGGRIPGNHFEINNGIPDFEMLSTNHTGYLKDDINKQYYEIGTEGQPGYGKIYVDAGSHVMTSIWTGMPLYYGGGERIDINVDSLNQLAGGIQSEIATRVDRAKGYMEKSIEIVKHEGSQYTARVNILQDQFKEMIEGEVGNTIFRGITTPNSIIQMELDFMIGVTYIAEGHCQSLNLILNSPPAQLLEFLTRTNVDVSTIFESIRAQLRHFKDIFDAVSAGIDRMLRRELVELFKGGTEFWLDAVVREMQAHFTIVGANNTLLENHITQYRTQISETASAFKNRDECLATAIQNQCTLDMSTATILENEVYKLVDSPFLVLTLRMKEIQVNTGYAAVQAVANTVLKPLLQVLGGILSTIERLLESAATIVRGAVSFGFNWTLPGILVGAFTDFDDKVRNMVNQALERIDELTELVESLRIAVTQLDSRLPAVIHSIKPYIDSAIFSKDAFQNVHLYNTATVALYDDMNMLFQDIVSQLSNHQADSITALQNLSQQVKDNIRLLREQTVRGTI